jgi:hypothetical protein
LGAVLATVIVIAIILTLQVRERFETMFAPALTVEFILLVAFLGLAGLSTKNVTDVVGASSKLKAEILSTDTHGDRNQ